MRKARQDILGCIPKYAFVPLLALLAVNVTAYWSGQNLAAGWKHYDLTTSFDRMVPVIPSFVTIYLVCYVFWVVNYILIIRLGKKECMRFVTAEMLAKIVCGVTFLVFPTTNVRPEILGNGIFDQLLRMVYAIDAPVNLFPSLHCLVSWFCFIGIRGREEIPKWYRVFSCIFALLVCVSTQMIKQHYIVDAVSAVVLAELSYYIVSRTGLYIKTGHIFERITGAVFRVRPLERKEDGSVW